MVGLKREGTGESNQFGESAVEVERQRPGRVERGRPSMNSTHRTLLTRGCVRSEVWYWVGSRRVGKRKGVKINRKMCQVATLNY